MPAFPDRQVLAQRVGGAAAAGSTFCIRARAKSSIVFRFDLDLDLGLVFGQVAVVVGGDVDGGAFPSAH
jgi:hypothetical protein